MHPTTTGINKIVFEVPDEFGFPPVLYWNNCSMLGKYNDELSYCRIDRIKRQTFITISILNSDDRVKIIRLTDTSIENLFSSPTIPGNFYLFKAQQYYQTTLREASRVNMTYVLGETIDF